MFRFDQCVERSSASQFHPVTVAIEILHTNQQHMCSHTLIKIVILLNEINILVTLHSCMNAHLAFFYFNLGYMWQAYRKVSAKKTL